MLCAQEDASSINSQASLERLNVSLRNVFRRTYHAGEVAAFHESIDADKIQSDLRGVVNPTELSYSILDSLFDGRFLRYISLKGQNSRLRA